MGARPKEARRQNPADQQENPADQPDNPESPTAAVTQQDTDAQISGETSFCNGEIQGPYSETCSNLQ
jgi:hypothetical protein